MATIEQALRQYPGYLKKSPEKIVERFGGTITEAHEALTKIRSELLENVNVSTHTTEGVSPSVFENSTAYEAFINESGINREDVVSVKYWQTVNGEPRFSVVTRGEQQGLPEDYREKLLSDIRVECSESLGDVPTIETKTGNFAVFGIPDLHLGKDGKNWSLEQAEATIAETFDKLIAFTRLHNVEEIIIPLGHDLLQVDHENISRKGTLSTTSSGTPIASNRTWFDCFRAARRLGSNLIRRSLEEAPTTVYIIPGNHSEQSEMSLGEVWDAQFESTRGVTINNTGEFSATLKRGKVGIFMTHGHTSQWEGLPLLFATVSPFVWGTTVHREVHTGHNHIKKSRRIGDHEDVQGTTVRISRSLSPQDSWHRKFGYNGIQGADVFVYNRDDGLIAQYSHNI